MQKFLHNLQIVEGIVPISLDGGANDGDWVNLANYGSAIVIFHSGIGTAGDDPTLTMEQATSAAGAGAKALVFADIYVKQAATNLAAVAQATKITRTTPIATYTEATAAEQDAIWVVEFTMDELDRAGGFTWLRARVADVGSNAQLASMTYLLCNPAYVEAPENLVGVIA